MFLSPLYVPFCLLGAGGLPRCLYLTDQSLLKNPSPRSVFKASPRAARGAGRPRRGRMAVLRFRVGATSPHRDGS